MENNKKTGNNRDLEVIVGSILPNAIGKLVVGTLEDNKLVGVNTLSLYIALSSGERFTRPDGRIVGYFPMLLSDLSQNEILNKLETASQSGAYREGKFGDIITQDLKEGERIVVPKGLRLSDYFKHLFTSGQAIDGRTLGLSFPESLYGTHAFISHQMEKASKQDANAKIEGGCFYLTPVINGKTTLHLFGESKEFGPIKNINNLEESLAQRYNCLTRKDLRFS